MLRKLESRPPSQIAVFLAISLRLFYSLVAAALTPFLRPAPSLIHSNALTENLPAPAGWHYALLGIWQRFDTLWYLRIAERGYDLPMAVIFYPLYPFAIRIASWLMPPVVAALVVSTVAAFFFFWGLLRLAQPDLTQPEQLRMLLLMSVWPTSFVLFAGYADALNLALIVWSVIFAREQRWWPATSCGILAGLCRPSGVLVAIPLSVIALRNRRAPALAVILSPLGLLSYWGWLRWTGRPSVVDAYRVYQGATLAPPWASVGEVLRLIASQHDVLLAIKLALVILVTALSLHREVRPEDKLFACAVIVQLLMYTGRPLLGAARYLMPAYPGFIMLGRYGGQRLSRKQFVFYFCASGFLNLAWMRAFLGWSLVL